MVSIDLQLADEQAARLDRYASSVRKSRDEATAQLIEEGLRHAEFPGIDFRESIAGRQAYVAGSGLAVWEVLMVARAYGLDAAKVAEHLRWPEMSVREALRYAAAYPAEIENALAENSALSEIPLADSLPAGRWIDTK